MQAAQCGNEKERLLMNLNMRYIICVIAITTCFSTVCFKNNLKQLNLPTMHYYNLNYIRYFVQSITAHVHILFYFVQTRLW